MHAPLERAREEVRARTDRERVAPQVWVDYLSPGVKGANGGMTPRECLDFESTAIESANVVDKGTAEYSINVLVQTL